MGSSSKLNQVSKLWYAQRSGTVEVHGNEPNGWVVTLRAADWIRRNDQSFRGATLEDAVDSALAYLAKTEHRVVCFWGKYFVSSLDDEFQATLQKMTEERGEPDRVEFRKHGTGWVSGISVSYGPALADKRESE
jgi:hypothetical protein